MSPIPAKVTAIEKRGLQYQVVVEIVPKFAAHFIPSFLERTLYNGSSRAI
jgi:hypothetical protein